jgi:hypothetical protein
MTAPCTVEDKNRELAKALVHTLEEKNVGGSGDKVNLNNAQALCPPIDRLRIPCNYMNITGREFKVIGFILMLVSWISVVVAEGRGNDSKSIHFNIGVEIIRTGSFLSAPEIHGNSQQWVLELNIQNGLEKYLSDLKTNEPYIVRWNIHCDEQQPLFCHFQVKHSIAHEKLLRGYNFSDEVRVLEGLACASLFRMSTDDSNSILRESNEAFLVHREYIVTKIPIMELRSTAPHRQPNAMILRDHITTDRGISTAKTFSQRNSVTNATEVKMSANTTEPILANQSRQLSFIKGEL